MQERADHRDSLDAGHEHHDHGAHGHGPQRLAPRLEALITGRGLTMIRGGRLILDAVDIDIAAGEIVTLIGPNGAGKTSLVRVLLGLEKPDDGRVLRRAGLVVGYVPQRFDRDAAVPMTVTRFLMLGRDASPADVSRALGEVGADRLRDRQLSTLSGGELQRVLLARALVRNPQLLVLDEPARGVDHLGEADLYALIGRLRDERGLGVLLVSHDLHVVMAQSDRVLCINRHVCCHGVPDTVSQHPEYVRLFGDQARAFGIYHHHHDHAHGLGGETIKKRGGGSAD
ncbi:MAG: metal ABC transporter ATP-binding protein [Hyphomicrobiaceae bacterium]|nr:metal ABC transporter ATP-binding protein [Hyphomicrobiaceae bacterium]